MFVPSDGIYQAALAQDPALIEYGVQQQMLMATPTTLIGLLWAVHYGWRQELIAESAREIAESARELHRRLGRFVEPLAKVGRQLDSAASAYNEAVGSFDHRVVPQVRRIEQAGAASEREVLPRRRSRPRRASLTARLEPDPSEPRSSVRRPRRRSRGYERPRPLRDLQELELASTLESRPAREHHENQRKRDRHGRGQLVDREEQQVEEIASTALNAAAAQLHAPGDRDGQQAPERAGDEQIAVTHHRGAEHGALQPRQPGGRVGGVQRVVRALQQVGDDERRVGERHRHDPRRQPPRRRDARAKALRARRS